MYVFNTKLLHVWFMIESYLPHRIWFRHVATWAQRDIDSGMIDSWKIRAHRKHQKRVISKISKQYGKTLNYER